MRNTTKKLKLILPLLLVLPMLGFFTQADAHVIMMDGSFQESPPVAAPEIQQAIITVVAGENLSTIAEQAGRSWEQLASFNKLSDPNLIFPGQVLNIPPTNYVALVAILTPKALPPPVSPPAPQVAAPAPRVSVFGVWRCIGHYESGNNPSENTGNGYYGEWQFSAPTWQTVMGQMYGKKTSTHTPPYYSYPYAAAAPEGFQLNAAEFLQRESGWDQWSTHSECGV